MRGPRVISRDQRGFTLIELLVVILIIGILAAIAIPAFLNQKTKADDAGAKVEARTAETAAETFATDHNGEYGEEMTTEALEKIEPALSDRSSAEVKVVEHGKFTYKIESVAITSKDKFWVERKENGVERTCEPASESNKGGCQSGGVGKPGNW